MSTDLLAVLDLLDEMGAAELPGKWATATAPPPGSEDTHAQYVVAVAEMLPRLTAAVRNCLRWAAQLEREALVLGAMVDPLRKLEAAQKIDAAGGIRDSVAVVLRQVAEDES